MMRTIAKYNKHPFVFFIIIFLASTCFASEAGEITKNYQNTIEKHPIPNSMITAKFPAPDEIKINAASIKLDGNEATLKVVTNLSKVPCDIYCMYYCMNDNANIIQIGEMLSRIYSSLGFFTSMGFEHFVMNRIDINCDKNDENIACFQGEMTFMDEKIDIEAIGYNKYIGIQLCKGGPPQPVSNVLWVRITER